MQNNFNIGKNISHYRKTNNLTQVELANKLNISMQAVSKWEQGITFPDISLLPAIADIFNISIDELFGKKQKTEPIFEMVENVPWNDDRKIRVAIYQGQKLMQHSEHELNTGSNAITLNFDYGKLYNINGICKLNKQ